MSDTSTGNFVSVVFSVWPTSFLSHSLCCENVRKVFWNEIMCMHISHESWDGFFVLVLNKTPPDDNYV